MKKRMQILAGALAASLLTVVSAGAQEIKIATTANAEVAAAFVAVEEGFFKKRGLDAKVEIIGLNPNIPPALISNSIQIGAPTPNIFAQAVENGLDLVTIAGVSVIAPTYTGVSVAAKPEANIATAKDFNGKTIAVPGLNAVLHVALQVWIDKNGGDSKQVRWVESPLPAMGDLLKAGRVDAVIGIDPFLPRLVESGQVVKVVSYFFREIAAGQQTMLYVTTREWAAKNAPAIKAFREGLKEADAFMKANPDKAREDIGKYFKLPPEALKTLNLPNTAVDVTPEQVVFWADVMRKLGLMNKPLEAAKVMVP